MKTSHLRRFAILAVILSITCIQSVRSDVASYQKHKAQAVKALQEGSFKDAAATFAMALDDLSKFDVDDPRRIQMLQGLALSTAFAGDFAGARRTMQQALELIQSRSGTQSIDYAGGLYHMALIHRMPDELEGAEMFAHQARATAQLAKGEDCLEVGVCDALLGRIYMDSYRYRDAASRFGKAIKNLSATRATGGWDFVTTISWRKVPTVTVHSPGYGALASLYQKRAECLAILYRTDEACNVLAEATGMVAKKLGKNHLALARLEASFGGVLISANRASEAERHLKTAIEIFERDPGYDPAAPVAFKQLIEFYNAQGRKLEADRVLTRALKYSNDSET